MMDPHVGCLDLTIIGTQLIDILINSVTIIVSRYNVNQSKPD